MLHKQAPYALYKVFALACTLGFQMLLMQALLLGPPELLSTPGFP